MHGVMRIGKRVNTKVMDYDLKELDTETIKRSQVQMFSLGCRVRVDLLGRDYQSK